MYGAVESFDFEEDRVGYVDNCDNDDDNGVVGGYPAYAYLLTYLPNPLTVLQSRS
jgi:hypothetical protein